jgi:acetate kinase
LEVPPKGPSKTPTAKSVEEMYQIFNKQSGFLGVSEVSNDSRDVSKAVEEGNPKAILADKLFIRRIADFIGQYFVRLGGADLIIFSAGIGENSSYYREKVCDEIAPALGVEIDKKLNASIRGKEALLSTPNSKIKVAVIPTDEEVMIARDTYEFYLKK